VQDLDEPAEDNDVLMVKAASLAGAQVFITCGKSVLILGDVQYVMAHDTRCEQN
jgi:hypothetical protein